MQNELNNLTVIRNILEDEVFSLFAKCAEGGRADFSRFVHAFYERKKFPEAGTNFMYYVENLIFYDENIVTKNLAGKIEIPDFLKDAYIRELNLILTTVESIDTQNLYTLQRFRTLGQSCNEIFEAWSKIYSKIGYGEFLRHYAFTYENGKLVPPAAIGIESANYPAPSISSLKDYAEEKKLIESNISNFIKNLPYSNMLLYGDRGTGKSSTIHALSFEHFEDRLRLIEVDGSNVKHICAVRRLVADSPLKFIILIDDLTIEPNDNTLATLKSCLEGTAAQSCNTMIVATSNRRHIVKENFSDRENAVHENDALQEQLALADRFGLTVMFSSTGKNEYLSIIKQLAADVKLNLDETELFALAERWAVLKGGRSPRRAKQFVDLVYACLIKGEEINF